MFPNDWQYFDYPDVFLQKGNLRYSPSADRIQMLDVDGWCDPMPVEQAWRLYGSGDSGDKDAFIASQREAERMLRISVGAPSNGK